MLKRNGNGALDKGGDSYPVWIGRVVDAFISGSALVLIGAKVCVYLLTGECSRAWLADLCK